MFEGHRPERQKPRARCESALLRLQENSVRNFTGRRGPVPMILPSVYAWFFLLNIKTESRQTDPAGRHPGTRKAQCVFCLRGNAPASKRIATFLPRYAYPNCRTAPTLAPIFQILCHSRHGIKRPRPFFKPAFVRRCPPLHPAPPNLVSSAAFSPAPPGFCRHPATPRPTKRPIISPARPNVSRAAPPAFFVYFNLSAPPKYLSAKWYNIIILITVGEYFL